MKTLVVLTTACISIFFSCVDRGNNQTTSLQAQTSMESNPHRLVATFGAGCFWCVEACFQDIEGVLEVISGYAGGAVPNPTYEQVSSGRTGHAEVAQIIYDSSKVTFDQLLEVFWTAHDPTTLNRQGADVGTQYRSVIFHHDEHQKMLAENYKQKLESSGAFDDPIVTEITPFTAFYKAEEYHQDYYNQNANQPYCMFVVKPKLDKIRKVFRDRLKAGAR